MKTFLFGLLVGVFYFSVNSTVSYAQEDHEKKAEQYLKKAIQSGKKGNAKGVARHVEEARKQLIEQNKEHPYVHPSVHIYGENPKSEHDDATFEEIAKAIGEAKQGNAKKAGDAARRAYLHLKEKERAK